MNRNMCKKRWKQKEQKRKKVEHMNRNTWASWRLAHSTDQIQVTNIMNLTLTSISNFFFTKFVRKEQSKDLGLHYKIDQLP